VETLKFEVADGIAWLTLNRPDVLNAVNRAMLRELWALVPKLEDDDVRVVVVRGAGRAFSAGADISEFGWANAPTAKFRREVKQFHDFYDFLERLEKPIIAAIHGICVGGGLEIAVSCDIRVARSDARLGFPEHKLGLIPNSGGCSRTMRLIGPGRTKELVMLGEFLDAEHAGRIGLVEHVYPEAQFDQEVKTLAEKLASRPAQALSMAKYAIDNAMETDRATGRYIERLAQSVLLKTADYTEGVQAFKEKRKPKFTGR